MDVATTWLGRLGAAAVAAEMPLTAIVWCLGAPTSIEQVAPRLEKTRVNSLAHFCFDDSPTHFFFYFRTSHDNLCGYSGGVAGYDVSATCCSAQLQEYWYMFQAIA